MQEDAPCGQHRRGDIHKEAPRRNRLRGWPNAGATPTPFSRLPLFAASRSSQLLCRRVDSAKGFAPPFHLHAGNEPRAGAGTALQRRHLCARRGARRASRHRLHRFRRQRARTVRGRHPWYSPQRAGARGGPDSGPADRGQGRVHRGGCRHERQPCVHRRQARGRHRVSHRRVFNGADRRHHPHRPDAAGARPGRAQRAAHGSRAARGRGAPVHSPHRDPPGVFRLWGRGPRLVEAARASVWRGFGAAGRARRGRRQRHGSPLHAAACARLRGERATGRGRHGNRRHVHGDLPGRGAPACLRAPAYAVRRGEPPHDGGRRGRNAPFTGRLLQNRQHRQGRRRV